MVFEAVVVDLLNKFLKQYIENLDTSQLKIGIWGGDVVLKDLQIKTILFDDFNLPVRVQWGKLGKLALKIPWKNLYSSNVIVDIEELLLVIIPKTEFEYDPVKEQKWENDKKQSRLKAVEEAKKKELALEPTKQNDGFVEKLVSQIIKNIQVEIRNIHIRYEDKTTNINFPFSVGVTMSNLSAQTTSEGALITLSKFDQVENTNFICKVVNLSGLAIYWNSHSVLFSDLPSKELTKVLVDNIPTNDHKPNGYDYVFGPLSASAFAQINPKPELDGSNFTIPKFFVNLHLKEIDLALTRNQFYDAILFAQDFRRLLAASRFRKYRPVNITKIGHAKEWWEFCYNCVAEDIKRRKLEWSWTYIKEHRKMCKKYFELFKIKITSKKVPSNVTEKLNALEKKLNVFNILLLREQAYLEIERDNTAKENKHSTGNWFFGWFGYGAESKPSSTQDELVKTLESVMTASEKKKLYKAIGYDESAPRPNYPVEFIEFQFWFYLEEIKVTIYDDDVQPFLNIMEISIKTVKLEFERRAEENAMKFVMAIGKFQIHGKKDTSKSDIPELVTSTCSDTESLVNILFETKPINDSCDQKVHISARPLRIVYHAETINRVKEIFNTGSLEVNLAAATSASLPVFQKITTMSLKYAIEKRNIIEVKINILSSYIIIPYGGVYKKNQEMLVFLLGSLTVETEKNELKELNIRKLYLEGTTEQDVFSTVLSASYTNFKCELKGVQILLQLNNESWVEASTFEGHSPLRFLESTNLVVTVKKSLVTDDARIPKIIVEGQLPSLTFNFSEDRFVAFAALLCSIPSRVEGKVQLNKKQSISAWSLQSFGSQLEKQFVQKTKDYVNKGNVAYLQGIDLLGHFEMSELVVKVSKTKMSKSTSKLNILDHSKKLIKIEEKFLNLRISKLEIELTNKTFERVNLVKLGEIEFQQYLGEVILPFVTTKKQDHYLFIVEYINVNPKIPDFYTQREAIVNRLTLNVTPLNVIFNQEAILAQLAFYKHIHRRLDDVKETCFRDRIGDAGKPTRGISLETLSIERKMLTKGRKFRKKKPKKEKIDFFLDANLEKIIITVENDNQALMKFTLKGGSVEISTRKSSTNVDLKLRKILLLDLNKDTLYTKIVESFDEETLSSRVTVYNSDYFGTSSSVDMSIEAEIGGLRFCFLNSFFSRALAFLSAFHVQTKILKEGATVAAQKAKENVMKAYQNTARICINIKIKAPLLIIPRKTCSYEVLFVDLGVLTVKNQITELDYVLEENMSSRPIIDTMKFHLQNLKFSRGILNLDMVTLDDEKTFLIPVTFELSLNRNLSTAWFKVIPELEILARLAAVHIKLTHYDLTVIFSVLKENLSEGNEFTSTNSSELEKPENKVREIEDTRTIYTVDTNYKEYANKDSSPNFYTTVKYMFFMDSFVFDAVMERDDSKEYTSNIGLARFVLETISLEGRLFSDASIDMSMLLVSCLLEDTRPGKIGRLTRLMERTADNDLVLNNERQASYVNSMVEVAYKKKEQDSFLDVKVYRFTLILSMEFLQKLGEFFTLEENNKVDKTENTTFIKLGENKARILKEEVEEKKEIERPPTFTFNLLVEKPDIVIVDNMDSVDAECLILHAEIVMKYRYAGSRKVISSTINDVELYSCCFNMTKRKNTLSQVIKPFTVSVAGSTPPDQGLHVDICFTEVSIIINPNTVELVSKCYEVLMGASLNNKKVEENKDFSNLWDVRPLKTEDQWFLKAEEGIDALTAISYSASETIEEKVFLEEVCLITIPSILLSLNGLAGSQSKPLLFLKMGFQSQCHNWSSKMNIISSLNLQLQYYNKIVSAWEPIIEPVEVQADDEQKIKHSYTPWEVNSTIVFDDEGYLDIEKPPKMSVTISCEEVLPITFTKSGVEVLKDVIDTFSSAVSKGLISKPLDLPPFIVKNQTGFAVELLLNECDLEVCNPIDKFYQTIKLEPSNEVLLQKRVEVRGLKAMSLIISGKKSSVLNIRFPSIKSTVFELPLNLTTKRYYPLRFGKLDKELWGLVADISIADSTTTISLQSVIKITNYFEIPISVHSLSDSGTSVDFVGTVEGRSSFTLPFQSVYRSQKKLFFSVKGYTFSSQAFCWTDIKSNFNISKLLHCDSRFNESYDPFFMQVEGEIEQIYFSNTNRRTLSSICYNIYLEPTVKIVNALPVDLIIICQGNSKDKTLRPGNNLQITNAELKGFSLSLRIQDYLEREWSCKEKIEESPAEFLVWKFVSYNGLTSEVINLGIHCTWMRKTAIYTIYCPYFMVNKTDRLLSYRFEGSETVFHHPSSLKIPMMFSPSFKKFFSKKSAYLKVRHSEWSEKFPVDVAGSGGTIECENPTSNSVYKVSVNIRITSNGLTKVITFTPYYVLTNETDCTIECQECDFPEHAWLKIPKNSCIPFWPLSKNKKKTIKIRPKGLDTSTPSFNYDSTDSCLLRLNNKYGGFFADIQATQLGTYVTFSPYEPGQAPVLIINYSEKNLKVYEVQSSFEIFLKPNQQILHAWVKPTGKRELSLSNLKHPKDKIIIEQDSIGLLHISKEESVQYVSFLDGAQRVLLFTDDVNLSANISTSAKDSNSGIEVICRIQGIGLSLVNNHTKTEIFYMACVSTGITWETKKNGKSRYKLMSSHMADIIEEAYNKYLHDCDTMPNVKSVVEITKQLKVDFNAMKIIHPHHRDLRRTFDPGLWMAYRVIEDQVMFDLKINRLQIDNQIRDCIFPVVLSPVPPPKTIAALYQRPKPFFEVSIIKKLIYKSGIDQFKYFEILIQEFQVKIDIGFLQQFWLFFAPEEISTEEKKSRFLKDLKLTQEPLQSHVEIISSQEHKNFYELLHFSPLKIRFSFSLAGKLDTKSLPPFLGITLQTLGVTLTDVHDVIFRLSYFERKFIFLTNLQLKNEVISHYHGQFVRQAYVLLLGLDVIGNPYGLIVGIGEGVEAFFYEPFHGIVHGPSEFATGVAIGCQSLFGRTVGSTAGTLGKLTETLGKGLAVLSLDKEYQLQRMETQHLHENIHTSMARGGRGLLMGVVEGVTGVVKKPIQGAKEEGVGGFFKGMGKGMMGLVTRPVTGVVDFASTSLNAVKRVAESHTELKQIRPPRFFRDEKLILPYNLYEATGNYIFYAICKRKYCSTDKYEHHIQLRNKEVVILTDKRMILAEFSDLYGTWQEHLSIRWSTMPVRPHCHSKGVGITLPPKTGVPKKEKPDVKVLLISNPVVKEEMCKKMVELYKLEQENLTDEAFFN